MRTCPECEFLMDDDATECKFCGAVVQRREPQPATATAAAAAAAPRADATRADATRAASTRGTSLPYAEARAPRRIEGRSTKVVAGVVVGVAVLLAGVGLATMGGDDGEAHQGPRVTAVAATTTAPVETTTTGLTALTTTSIPPKTALGGQTVSIGMPGHFTATMPAGTSKVASDNRLTTWGATLPGGSTITFTARTAVSIAERFKTSVGRIDVTRYGARVNLDLGVTGTPPRFGAFATGSGAEWDTSTGSSSGRVTLIDGGSMAYLLVLQRAGGPPTGDIAAYLAVSASLTPA